VQTPATLSNNVAGDREPLALDADRNRVFDMRTFVLDQRGSGEDDVDKVIRSASQAVLTAVPRVRLSAQSGP